MAVPLARAFGSSPSSNSIISSAPTVVAASVAEEQWGKVGPRRLVGRAVMDVSAVCAAQTMCRGFVLSGSWFGVVHVTALEDEAEPSEPAATV
jgi:hypothetical protein